MQKKIVSILAAMIFAAGTLSAYAYADGGVELPIIPIYPDDSSSSYADSSGSAADSSSSAEESRPDSSSSDSKPVHKHFFVEQKVPATYTKQGYTRRYCKGCGYEQKINYTPKKVLAAPKSAGVGVGVTSCSIKWKKSAGATSYRIYQYDSKAKKYNRIAVVGASKTSYSRTKLKDGSKYKFKVIACVTEGKTTVLSKSAAYSVVTKPKQAKVVSLTPKNGKVVVVNWKKQNASGYEIYGKTSKGWKKCVTVTKGSATKYRISASKCRIGKKYAVKVRAYVKDSNGKKQYGKFSPLKTCKV